jgi:hypothetical protein
MNGDADVRAVVINRTGFEIPFRVEVVFPHRRRKVDQQSGAVRLGRPDFADG